MLSLIPLNSECESCVNYHFRILRISNIIANQKQFRHDGSDINSLFIIAEMHIETEESRKLFVMKINRSADTLM
jgi:hypothetical protein